MSQFSKKYDFIIEKQLYSNWLENNIFFNDFLDGDNFDFALILPPINITGNLHLGHALSLTIQDFLYRYYRLIGKNVIMIPGLDHAGISAQQKVEKNYIELYNKTKNELGKDKFIKTMWEWISIHNHNIKKEIQSIGIGCDWNKLKFTLSEDITIKIRSYFKLLMKKNIVQHGDGVFHWCKNCQSVLSNFEVKKIEKESKKYYLRYFIEGKGDSITITTFDPQNIFADVAIMVNPKDKRYKKIIGKNVLIPIINKPIPVIADESIDIMNGVGTIRVTPSHDLKSFELAKKHGLQLDNFAIDIYGKYTFLAGEFFAKEVEDVYENVIQYLYEIGNIEKVENVTINNEFCERCNTKLYNMYSKQWYINSVSLTNNNIDKIKSITNNSIFEYIENNLSKDSKIWPISRQFRWGLKLPVWYCECNTENVFDEEDIVQKDSKYIILSKIIFNLIADNRIKQIFNIEDLINILSQESQTNGYIYNNYLIYYKNLYKDNPDYIKEISKIENIFNTIQNNSGSIVTKGGDIIDIIENSVNIKKKGDMYKYELLCKKCGSSNLKQDNDIFDSRFISGLWLFLINDLCFRNNNNGNIVTTGNDIFKHWIENLMLLSQELNDTINIDKIFMHGLVVDEKQNKLSRTDLNYTKLSEYVDKYGADSVRLTLLCNYNKLNNIKVSNLDFEYYSNFLSKLWNATRYILSNQLDLTKDIVLNYEFLKNDIEKNINKLNDFDRWIIGKFSDYEIEMQSQIENNDISNTINGLLKLVWFDFCDWYLEITKIEKSEYSNKVLLYINATILKLLHPIVPFITEKLWFLLNFENNILNNKTLSIISFGTKNYKINVLMDIINQLSTIKKELEFKPHEKVDIFIQGNSSFIDFAKKYENFMKVLLNIDKIDYLMSNDKAGSEYSIFNLYDLNIGLKGFKELNSQEKLIGLENQLKLEQQLLQNIRNLIMNVGNSMDHDTKQDKLNHMEDIKSRIANIELEINLIKLGKR